jgi:hypothetical protein
MEGGSAPTRQKRIPNPFRMKGESGAPRAVIERVPGRAAATVLIDRADQRVPSAWVRAAGAVAEPCPGARVREGRQTSLAIREVT